MANIPLKERYEGCLIGGAAGDALGYTVEFMRDYRIFEKYGNAGHTELDMQNNVAVVSDDTQMTLFTAEGICRALDKGLQGAAVIDEIYKSYLDWLATQERIFDPNYNGESELLRDKRLFESRAPGRTCLSALGSGYRGSVAAKINKSKGCGGIMRVAPVPLALFTSGNLRLITTTGAESAALTHGHELGFIPAGFISCLIVKLLLGADVVSATGEALELTRSIYGSEPHFSRMEELITRAVELGKNDSVPVLEAIKQLGEGWVAEETLAIALFCSIRYENDFEAALVAAVNHSGDSDSTGAVTGNILGARLGRRAIPVKYIEKLELIDVIAGFAHKLYDKSVGVMKKERESAEQNTETNVTLEAVLQKLEDAKLAFEPCDAGRKEKITGVFNRLGITAEPIAAGSNGVVQSYRYKLSEQDFGRASAVKNDIATLLAIEFGIKVRVVTNAPSEITVEVMGSKIRTVPLRPMLKSMQKNEKGLSFPIGVTGMGDAIVFDLTKSQNVLITGGMGSGKSAFVQAMILSLMAQYTPSEVKFQFYDSLGSETGAFRRSPHLYTCAPTGDKERFGSELEALKLEILRRFCLMMGARTTNFDEYNAMMARDGAPTLPRIVVVINEITSLLNVSEKLTATLKTVLGKCRSAGVYVVGVTWTKSADCSDEILSQFPCRIHFREDGEDSDAALLYGSGDMLIRKTLGAAPVRAQCVSVTLGELDGAVSAIKNAYGVITEEPAAAPVVEEAAPVVEEATPVEEEAAPVVEKASPVEEVDVAESEEVDVAESEEVEEKVEEESDDDDDDEDDDDDDDDF